MNAARTLPIGLEIDQSAHDGRCGTVPFGCVEGVALAVFAADQTAVGRVETQDVAKHSPAFHARPGRSIRSADPRLQPPGSPAGRAGAASPVFFLMIRRPP